MALSNKLICDQCSCKVNEDNIFLTKVNEALFVNCQDCFYFCKEMAEAVRTTYQLGCIYPGRFFKEENNSEIEFIGRASFKTYLIKKNLNF